MVHFVRFHVLFIHSPVAGHLDCYRLETNKKNVNNHVSLFLFTLGNASICHFLKYFTSMSRQFFFCLLGLPFMNIVGVCLCICHLCMCRCVYVKTKAPHWVSSSIAFHLILRQDLSWNPDLTNLDLLARKLWRSSCLPPFLSRDYRHALHLAFYMGLVIQTQVLLLVASLLFNWAISSPRALPNK